MESLAILYYLEIKYPTPSLLLTNAEMLATVYIVELLTVNAATLCPLNRQWLGLGEKDSQVDGQLPMRTKLLQIAG